MLIKICGLTNVDDVHLAVEAGADLIGVNLWPGSKRYVAPAEVAPLLAAVDGRAQTVAVLVNPGDDEIENAVAAGFDWLQLHGDETPERCRALPGEWLKALRLDEASFASLCQYGGSLLLVDAPSPGYGGSGRVADWTLAERAARLRPILLAGGLTPDLVADAIYAVRPAGVDVASGVERSPRQKDPAALKAFVDAVRRVE